MGLPHKAPVHKDKKAKMAPVGAKARHIIPDKRVLNVMPKIAQKAMAK